jgi:hypothetical protein
MRASFPGVDCHDLHPRSPLDARLKHLIEERAEQQRGASLRGKSIGLLLQARPCTPHLGVVLVRSFARGNFGHCCTFPKADNVNGRMIGEGEAGACCMLCCAV